jgi:CPA1 family monovalent cation:H+ antiporter
MELLQLVVFLLLCAVALGWVARRFNFPYPIALVIGGGALSFVPRLPQFPFDPQFILVLVLPPILYQAALLTSWRDFKANIRPIGLLAIGLVIVTTLAVGTTLKLLIPECPWGAAFVFGAIVSPPDAVAATAILSRLKIPRRVVVVLEGESLVNDASGLVLYKFAVAAVMTGAFSLIEASAEFVGVAAGGIVVGVLLARLFIAVHRRLGDVFIEVLTTLAVPYVAYIVAESLHVSGVLAVVTAGLVRGRYAPVIVSAEMRIIARSVWNMLVFLLNSLIFMLIGIQLSEAVEQLVGYSGGRIVYVRDDRQRHGNRGALRVGLSSHVPSAHIESRAAGARTGTGRRRSVHHELVRHARHRIAGRSACVARHARERSAVSATRPDHLSHLHSDRCDARRAGPEPAAADPPAESRYRSEPA